MIKFTPTLQLRGLSFRQERIMALLTTTIGAYPKPDYVPTPDWFRKGGTGLSSPTEAYQK
jgi:hypothetical protein